MDKAQLLKNLILEADKIGYRSNNLEGFKQRTKMVIRKVFGDSSHYLADMDKIRYTLGIYTSNTPSSSHENAFNRGVANLKDLVKVMLEDLQLGGELDGVTLSNAVKNGGDVFIVHGHNQELKLSVARTVQQLELNPIILHEQPNKGKTIIEKFSEYSQVGFAIIILSADDLAFPKESSKGTASLRARQNVIFEMGYFIGRLGRERVFCLYETLKNFEIPSDYSGVVLVPYDADGRWKFDLVKELRALGMNVDANKVL